MIVALCLAFILLLCFGLTLWAVHEYLGPLKAEPEPQPAILVAALTEIEKAVRKRDELRNETPSPMSYWVWRDKYLEACRDVDRLRSQFEHLKWKIKQH